MFSGFFLQKVCLKGGYLMEYGKFPMAVKRSGGFKKASPSFKKEQGLFFI